MSKHSHSIITACVVILMSLIGYGIYAAVGMAMFYIGREHSQAEYRYMKYHGINRSKLKQTDVLKKEAWSYDSLTNDMLIPIIVGAIVYITIKTYAGA